MQFFNPTPQIIQVEKDLQGNFTQTSKDKFSMQMKKLAAGMTHEIHVYEGMGKKYKGREKYHFGFLLPYLIRKGKLVSMPKVGLKPVPITTKELHYIHKCWFNGVTSIHPFTGELTVIPQSTVGKPDGWFVGEFEELIISHWMTVRPEIFDEEFMTREEWIDMMAERHHEIEKD